MYIKKKKKDEKLIVLLIKLHKIIGICNLSLYIYAPYTVYKCKYMNDINLSIYIKVY